MRTIVHDLCCIARATSRTVVRLVGIHELVFFLDLSFGPVIVGRGNILGRLVGAEELIDTPSMVHGIPETFDSLPAQPVVFVNCFPESYTQA